MIARPAETEPVAEAGALPVLARIELADPAATDRLGADLAIVLKRGDVVALHGDLGAGKSSLARAAIRALARRPDMDVPSPTFTLVQTYEGMPPVAHFDLYRLSDGAELDELGFEEATDEGIVFVEWPQRSDAVLARADLHLTLEPTCEGGRIAILAARETIAPRIRRTLAIRAFLAAAGHGEAPRRPFPADASVRRYELVEAASGETLILMDNPPPPASPVIRDGLTYRRIVHAQDHVLPFVAVAEALAREGFAAPRIHHADLKADLLLTEHLGTGSVLDAEGRPIPERYEAAALCLAELHARHWGDRFPVAGDEPYRMARFDRRAMATEVELLPEWYLRHAKGRTPSDAERARFAEVWDALFEEMAGAETSLLLRDMHSPNIVWREGAAGVARVGLIDFQDAMIGPAAYDLASLAQDARVDVAPELEARLVAAYLAARRGAAGFDPFEFERDYAIMAAQRNSKILGLFVRLLERDGKPQYLRHIPRIRRYLTQTLRHPSLAALRSLYSEWGIPTD